MKKSAEILSVEVLHFLQSGYPRSFSHIWADFKIVGVMMKAIDV